MLNENIFSPIQTVASTAVDQTWLQQYGVSSDYARYVRNYVNKVFLERYIRRRREIEWPANSTD